jgi:hypothetical protein
MEPVNLSIAPAKLMPKKIFKNKNPLINKSYSFFLPRVVEVRLHL